MAKSKSNSASAKASEDYPVGTKVLAKVKGFPPWPAEVLDDADAPPLVAKSRPGIAVAVHLVKFFGSGDYSWLPHRELSKLKQHEIEAYVSDPPKKSSDLLTAYRIALDPKKYAEEQAALDEDNDEEDADADADVDQLEEDSASKKKGGKTATGTKRKRDTESASAPAKKRASSAGAKSKKNGAGADSASAPVKKRAAGGAGKKKNGVKSKEAVESEDDAEGDEEPGPSQEAPVAKKGKKGSDKEKSGGGEDFDEAALANDPEALRVREWRHRLQKTFLPTTKSAPKQEDLPSMEALFTEIENYEKMDIAYLSFSKIGKVMRHITALADERVPQDSEYRFRERAKNLVDKWHIVLHNGMVPPDANGKKVADKNGTEVADDKKQGEKKEDAMDTTSDKAEVKEAVKEGEDVGMVSPSIEKEKGELGDVTMGEASA